MGDRAPRVVDLAADRAFRDLARARGLQPDNLWVGGYVDYEWAHGRYFLQAYAPDLHGRTALEYGCNVGGTAIVLDALGAAVVGIDVDARAVELAQLNASRHGAERIELRHVADTTSLPYAAGHFDFISCNSVLEYVPQHLFAACLRELDRVLKPGGLLLVIGTSNRLAPREVHSRRWLVNYLPRSRSRQRGISPPRIRRAFPSYRDLVREDGARSYFAARRAAGGSRLKLGLLRGLGTVGRTFGWSVGMLTPSMFMALRKPPAAGSPA